MSFVRLRYVFVINYYYYFSRSYCTYYDRFLGWWCHLSVSACLCLSVCLSVWWCPLLRSGSV